MLRPDLLCRPGGLVAVGVGVFFGIFVSMAAFEWAREVRYPQENKHIHIKAFPMLLFHGHLSVVECSALRNSRFRLCLMPLSYATNALSGNMLKTLLHMLLHANTCGLIRPKNQHQPSRRCATTMKGSRAARLELEGLDRDAGIAHKRISRVAVKRQ